MKQAIISLCLITFTTIAVYCFIRKLIIWLQVEKKYRIGFLLSFIIFFSVHDVHNASTPADKKFHSSNNKLNAFFWLALFALCVVFVFNTDEITGLIPTKRENYYYKK